MTTKGLPGEVVFPLKGDVDVLRELRRLRDGRLLEPSQSPASNRAVPLRTVIEDSWKRASAAGVSPTLRCVDVQKAPTLDRRVIAAAAPILRKLVDEVADNRAAVIFSDSSGAIVESLGDKAVLRALDRAGAAPGHLLAEDAAGTNGIGTALHAGCGIQVVGAEHFIEAFQMFSCTCFPVRDPFTGEICASLDVTVRAIDHRPDIYEYVRTAAIKIEESLHALLIADQMSLIQHYLAITTQGDVAVLATNGETIVANRRALNLLQGMDREIVINRLFAEGSQPDVGEIVELETRGALKLIVRIQRVVDEYGKRGVVAILEPHIKLGKATTAMPASATPPLPELIGRSPAFVAAVAKARRSASEPGLLLIAGEPGTGKATLAITVGAQSALTMTVVDAITGITQTYTAAPFGHQNVSSSSRLQYAVTVILRLEKLREEDVASCPAVKKALQKEGLVIATTRSPSRILPALRKAASAVICLPRLEERTDDIPRLAQWYLLNRQRRLTIDQDALALLQRMNYEENVRSLFSVLEAAAEKARGFRVTRDDIIAVVGDNVPTRRGMIEELSVRAVRDALAMTGGNRSAAARVLGISRATLYRWLKHFGEDLGAAPAP